MSPLSRIVFEWGLRAFGSDHMHNKRMRALRLLEEAVELVQACEVPQEKALELILIIYKRPIGDVAQELGGIAVTLSVFCTGQGLDVDEIFENEVCRVLAKSPEHFAARNEEKIAMGLK